MAKAAPKKQEKPIVEKPVDSVEKSESKKPVEISGQKSQDINKEQNDDLQSHPKFAKFKPSGGK